MSSPAPRSIRQVVFHLPGPKWQPDIDYREQEGVGQHVRHYLKFHEQGKLELGGPCLLQDAGGMMIATKEVTREDLEAFAAANPAV